MRCRPLRSTERLPGLAATHLCLVSAFKAFAEPPALPCAVSVLRCGVDACVAMAALIWALAARGGDTMARLLLRRCASL